MAEVGVLELTIRDNSEQAADGLKQLAGALKSVKDEKKNFSLAGVNTQIKSIVDGVKDNVKVVEQLGKLFNALSQFGKIKNLSIDTEQFKNLKEAINGMTIGQTGTQLENIRKALSGEWKTENLNSVMSSMNAVSSAASAWKQSGTAESILDVSKALIEYNSALKETPKDSPFRFAASTIQSEASTIKQSASDIKNAIDKVAESQDNWLGDTVRKHHNRMMSVNLQQFASKKTDVSEGQTMMDLDALMKTTESVEKVQNAVKDAASDTKAFNSALEDTSRIVREMDLNNMVVSPLESMMDRFNHVADASETLNRALDATSYSFKGIWTSYGQLENVASSVQSVSNAINSVSAEPLRDVNIVLKETGDIVESVTENRFKDMYQMFGDLADRAGWFKKETMRLMEGEDIHRAVAEDNMLSAYRVDWKPDWTYADPSVFDAYIAKLQEMYQIWSTFVNEWHMFQMEGARLMSGNSPFLLGDGTIPGLPLLTDGADNFLSTWVDTGEQWKQNWVEYSSDVAQAMRDSWQPDWTMFEDGVDKAKLVEEALQRITVMKSELFARIENGDIGQEEALKIAAQIEELEKKIPIIQNDISQAVQEANNATSAFDQTKNAVNSVSTSTKDVRSETEKIENVLQNIVAIAETWKTMMSDQRATVKDIYKNNELVSGVIGKLDSLKGDGLTQFIDSIKEVVNQSIDAKDKVEKLYAVLRGDAGASAATSNVAGAMQKVDDTVKKMSFDDAKAQVDSLVANMSSARAAYETQVAAIRAQISDLTVKENELRAAMAMEIYSGKSSADEMTTRAAAIRMVINEKEALIQKLHDIESEQNSVVSTSQLLASAFNEMKSDISGLFPGLSRLAKQFTNIAKRMMIRSIIRTFVQGMKEGLQTFYYWSKANNTEFAPAMDAAATAVLALKNSLGALAAEVLSAALPALTQLANAAINVINWLNQVFAVANGKDTYQVFVSGSAKVEDAFGKIKKSAGGAGGAIKELLADWDELNIIQSESGGGGGGGSGTLDDILGGADYDTKKITDPAIKFIGEHLGEILGSVAAFWFVFKFKKLMGVGYGSETNKLIDIFGKNKPQPKTEPKGTTAATDKVKEQVDEAKKTAKENNLKNLEEGAKTRDTVKNIVSDATEKLTDGQQKLLESTNESVNAAKLVASRDVHGLAAGTQTQETIKNIVADAAEKLTGEQQKLLEKTTETVDAVNNGLVHGAFGIGQNANIQQTVGRIVADTQEKLVGEQQKLLKATTEAEDEATKLWKDQYQDWLAKQKEATNESSGSAVGGRVLASIKNAVQTTVEKLTGGKREKTNVNYLPYGTYDKKLLDVDNGTGDVENIAPVIEDAAIKMSNAVSSVQSETKAALNATNEAAQLITDGTEAAKQFAFGIQAASESVNTFDASVKEVAKSTSTVETVTDTGIIPYGKGDAKTWEEYVLTHSRTMSVDEILEGYKDEPFEGAFVKTPDGEIMYVNPEKLEVIKTYGLANGYTLFGDVNGVTKPDMSKLEQAYWNLNNINFGKIIGNTAVAAIVTDVAAQLLSNRYQAEEAYKDFYGERYINLNAREKRQVRDQGILPEDAETRSQIMELLYQRLPDIIKWVPNTADKIEDAVDNAAVEVGKIATEAIDEVNKVSDTVEKEFIDPVATLLFGPFAIWTAGIQEKGETAEDAQKRQTERMNEWLAEPVVQDVIETGVEIIQDVNDWAEDVQDNFDVLTDYFNSDEYENWNGAKNFHPWLVTGGAGVSDVGPRYNPYLASQAGTIEEPDTAAEVEKGSKAANGTLEDNTSVMITLLRQLLAKNFSVNITPSSGLAFVNRRSEAIGETITGW